jgi:hypothetical protein
MSKFLETILCDNKSNDYTQYGRCTSNSPFNPHRSTDLNKIENNANSNDESYEESNDEERDVEKFLSEES